MEWISICARGHFRLAGVRLIGEARVGHPAALIELHPGVGMVCGHSPCIPVAGNVFPVQATNPKVINFICLPDCKPGTNGVYHGFEGLIQRISAALLRTVDRTCSACISFVSVPVGSRRFLRAEAPPAIQPDKNVPFSPVEYISRAGRMGCAPYRPIRLFLLQGSTWRKHLLTERRSNGRRPSSPVQGGRRSPRQPIIMRSSPYRKEGYS